MPACATCSVKRHYCCIAVASPAILAILGAVAVGPTEGAVIWRIIVRAIEQLQAKRLTAFLLSPNPGRHAT